MGDDDDHDWQKPRGRHRNGRDNQQFRPDIATEKNINKEKIGNLTTYFVTDFPDNFGAKALFNAFHHYGNIKEVVVPAKKDKGGRRFGFARFDRVEDPRQFENELDTIIIGRDKISVNLSRFQRPEGINRSKDRSIGRKGIHDHNRSHHTLTNNHHQAFHQQSRAATDGSYAQAVRKGGVKRQDGSQKQVALTYEAEENDMLRLKKAFIGVVKHPGMTYNIQKVFHSQGYFGVNVTPLGSNLTLLEGQEDGEVQALMGDAKEWLNQWFKEIRPWNPKDVDSDRIVWLRVFGIPAHAWSNSFFARITKPWGIFMNADELTSKKLSMDVARLLIRTSCQKTVDEFIDVKINDDYFHLRVIEDSYGPMRIMLSQPQDQDGRILSEDGDEDDEEEERRLLAAAEDLDGETEGEGENLLALNSLVNANNSSFYDHDQVEETFTAREERVENSIFSINGDTNPSIALLNSKGGSTWHEGDISKEDILDVYCGKGLGQKVVVGGPAPSINSQQIVTGGAFRNLSKSEDLSHNKKTSSFVEGDSGGKEEVKKGVYSDGPRNVYNKLNCGLKRVKTPKKNQRAMKSKGKIIQNSLPPSASLRRQYQMVNSLKSRNSRYVSTPSVACPSHSDEDDNSIRQFADAVVTRRNSPSKTRDGKKQACSISSAGDILCCSSINSSDIRNCNKKFLKKYEQEVASKVWQGALELGVEVTSLVGKSNKKRGIKGSTEEKCIQEIQDNVKRDEVERIRREHQQSFHK